MATMHLSRSIVLFGVALSALALVIGCGGGGGGSSSGSGSSSGTGGTVSFSKLALIDSEADSDTTFPDGIGADGKIALYTPLSTTGYGGTLTTAGRTYTVPASLYVLGVFGTSLIMTFSSSTTPSSDMTVLAHLNTANSTIVTDKTFTGCSSYVINADGTTENEYDDSNFNLIKLTIVSPTGVETPLPVPDPAFLPEAVATGYIAGEVESSSSTSAKISRQIERRLQARKRTSRSHRRSKGVGRSLASGSYLVSQTATVALQIPSADSSGSSYVVAVNKSGVTVGGIYNLGTDGSTQLSLTWSRTGVATLLPDALSGYPNSETWDINDNGIIVGDVESSDYSTTEGVVWQSGKIQPASAFISPATNYGAFTYIDDQLRVGGDNTAQTEAYLLQGS
jgi:hypothetical protein